MAVSVSIAAAATTVEPGKGSTCEIRVGNSAATDVTVRLEIKGKATEWALILPSEVFIPAGAEAVARVMFHVPRAAYPMAGLSTYRIEATSRSDAADHAVADGLFAIGAFTDTEAELVPTVSQGGPTEHAFRLRNRGNSEVRAAITALADDAATTIAVQPAMVIVQPGETQTATVRLGPRKRLLGRGKRHSFRVTASPQGGAPVEVHGVVEPTPGPSPWLGRLVVTVAVSLIVGLVSARSPLWSPSRPSSREVVAEAMADTARAPSSRISVVMEVIDPASPSDASGYRLEGVLDYRRNVGRFALDIGGAEGHGIAGTVEVIKGPSALYLRMPDASSSRLARRWLVLGPQELTDGSGLDVLDENISIALTAAVTGLGVIRELLQLGDLATDAAPAGEQSLRGETTKRYHLDLDSDVLPVPGLQELGATVGDPTADVWIDGRGQARQIRLSLGASVTDASGSRGGVGTFTTEFFDFGVAVHVEDPPHDEVVSPAGIAAVRPN